MAEAVTIVETPRDAFQGLPRFVPTAEKIEYIKALLAAGYKHIDLGSFVSPKAVPQMADSEDVVRAFAKETSLERIAIIVNEQGLDRAIDVGGLEAVGFPFSLSNQFQVQNTRSTTTQTWPLFQRIINKAEAHDLSLILYLSMAFGNPYGEPCDDELLFFFVKTLSSMGARHISLADTVAIAKPEQVGRIFTRARKEYPKIEFSAHFHGKPNTWFDCVQAALEAGCRRFDAASGGMGGCPFAQDALVANIPSELLVEKLAALGYTTNVDTAKAKECAALAKVYQRKYGTEARASGITPRV